MIIDVKVPQLSESVAEATLVSWHKKAGEAVSRDENLIDIETDKVVLELPAPDGGVLVEIIKGDGESVVSGEAKSSPRSTPRRRPVQLHRRLKRRRPLLPLRLQRRLLPHRRPRAWPCRQRARSSTRRACRLPTWPVPVVVVA